MSMSFGSAKTGKLDDKLISYDDALAIVRDTACEHAIFEGDERVIPTCMPVTEPWTDTDQLAPERSKIALLDALNRRSATRVVASQSTPQHDTSAMDGYAVCSSSTLTASEENPLLLRVVDYIAAGDSPNLKWHDGDLRPASVCVEIMTGARFPENSMSFLDSVVKVEDVVVGEDWSADRSVVSRHILLRKPVNSFQHRRPAGSDIKEGTVVVEEGDIIRPKHIAALASLGVVDIEVLRPSKEVINERQMNVPAKHLRIGILSTGSEIVDSSQRCLCSKRAELDKQRIPDSNGPYLISTLRSACPSAKVIHLGIAGDNEDALTEKLMTAIDTKDLDIIVTSGGVSRGRYDLVREVVETRLKGRIKFHGARMRPGAPVLFGTLDTQSGKRPSPGRRQITFFGAPGNPLAAAVTLRFFVLPYVLSLSSCSERIQQPLRRGNDGEAPSLENNFACYGGSTVRVSLGTCRRKPRDMTVFWLAKRSGSDNSAVDILDDQASYKLNSIVQADCWVVISAGISEVHPGDELLAYSL
ncbi:hypothetical protein PMZ80_009511 [Knufia obscura]|uniref:molybdopterin adenylyltransferase n=1 Tax=Knufia obscura TaxID=1635080 RepID=A0ABR0RE72_9EURO|nr:hypothetical protein PMZ80_009511 [Knufia obscura]